MSEAPIQWHAADLDFTWPEIEKTSTWIEGTISRESQELSSLHIIACSDDYLLEINRAHLNHDYYTDIITFPYQEDVIDGELYISIDRVRENAQKLEIPFIEELRRVVIHGILHLCGYDDETAEEKTEMRKRENTYLDSFLLL